MTRRTPLTEAPAWERDASPMGLSADAEREARRTAGIVLVVASMLLIGSLLTVPWIARSGPGAVYGPTVSGVPPGFYGPGMMPGGGMMSGLVWLPGNGVAVTTISSAKARAALAGQQAGLHPGEVMQFSNGFYAELKDSAGASVTEVLVSPPTGAVATEPGPAMMWNTGSRVASISPDRARTIADQWLASQGRDETVKSLDTYPGYYTADTASGGRPVGMLSVNASTGAVWYHTWHGTFLSEEGS